MKNIYKNLLVSILFLFIATNLYAAYPVVASVGNEENLGPGRLSYVTVDNLGQPHVACDGGSMAYFYDKVNNKWISSSMNVGNYGSKQWFNPFIEMDNNGNAWSSGILYPYVVGADSGGIGIIIRPNVMSSPGNIYFSRKSQMPRNWDCGNFSYDIFRNEAVTFGTGQYYGRHVNNVTVAGFNGKIAGGTFYVGNGGESQRIKISRAGAVKHADNTIHGVWHVALTGHAGFDYSKYNNSVRVAQKLPSVVWGDPNYYKEMGSDGNYAGISSDARMPEFAYISTDLNNDGGQGGVYANVFNGKEMVCPPSNMLIIDRNGTTGQRRFEPLMSPSKYGGVFIIWSNSGKIFIRYIGPNGLMGKPEKICDGTKGSICCDNAGNIHIVYNKSNKSTVSYRKIIMSTTYSIGFKFNYNNVSQMGVYDAINGVWYIKDIINNVIASNFRWGGESQASVSGDFDGDKFGDIATYDTTTYKWYIYSIKLNKSLLWDKAYGGKGCKAVSGDYNGDGKSDIAVFNQSIGKWYVMDLNGNNIIWDYSWGYNRSIPVAGDYDGDGKFDLAVFDEDTAKWYIYSYAKNAVLAWDINLGISNSVPVSGDFDGDGKYDLAVWNLETAKWYIQKLDGTKIYWDTNWGYKGSVCGAGDFDGDGADDIAVFDYLGIIKYGDWYIYSIKKQAVLAWAANWGYKGVVPTGFSIGN